MCVENHTQKWITGAYSTVVFILVFHQPIHPLVLRCENVEVFELNCMDSENGSKISLIKYTKTEFHFLLIID